MRMMEGIRWAFNFANWNPTQEEWLLCTRCVQPEESQRIHRFVFKRDAKAAMAGRLLLRKVVQEQLGISYPLIQLVRSEKGKPFLAETEPSAPPSFNVSHQGSYSVLAFERDFKVGVDVMKIEYVGGKTVPEFFRTMRRQFTPHEWSNIKYSSNEKDQLTQFYRHWCLKESYVKAVGIGIGFDLQRLNFVTYTRQLQRSTVTTDTQLQVDGTAANDWLFEETMIDDQHCTAVALGRNNEGGKELPSEGSHFHQLEYGDLVSTAVPWQPLDEQLWPTFCQKEETPGGARTTPLSLDTPSATPIL